MKKKTIRVFREVDLDLGLDRLPSPGTVNVEDAAAFLGVSDETVRRHIDEGRIKARKQHDVHGRTGWRWVIDTTEVNRVAKLARQVTQTWLAPER